MSKQKNKSFVEIKAKKNNNNEENIIDPFKKYEYIEPKKKKPIKQIILTIFIIIAITLTIILAKIIDKSINIEQEQNIDDNTTTTSTTTQTTTTNNINNTTNNVVENNIITETLICNSEIFENNLQFYNQTTANFYNNKLRNDINYMSIKLLDESAKEEFDTYVDILKMFSLYLNTKYDYYDITEYTSENEFSLSIKTIYQQNQKTENSLLYDEEYDSVKQKLIKLGYECK